MDKLVTVFTPSYNRAKLIPRCYESLKNQTSFNFKWLIVDDGSSDGTGQLVSEWIKTEKKFEIKYLYKENGGLHTAYNAGIPLVDTELFTCLESDDYFTPDAISIIEKEWPGFRDKGYTGFISLTKDPEGNLIGLKYPENLDHVYYWKHRRIAPGDKQYVFRTDLLKKEFPMPVFKGEKFYDPKFKFFSLDQYGPLGVTNEVFDVADYQEGGLTDTVLYHYYNSPNSFAEYRKMYMQLPEATLFYLYKQNIHYVSSCVLAGKPFRAIGESPRPGFTIAAFLPGVLLSVYISFKNRRHK